MYLTSKDAATLLIALRSSCENFSSVLDLITADYRTPTRGVIPRYVLISLGDEMGKLMGPNDFSLVRECWCCSDDDGRTVLALALSRLAMACPDEAYDLVNGLEECGGWQLLARWVYPVLGIWDPSYLESIGRRDMYLLSWAWYAKYVPEDFDLSLDKVLGMSEVVDKLLIIALK